MATQTTYYNLVKPAGTEAVDVAVINANYDKIDTEINRNRTTAALDLADIYDSTASYAVGDYCVFLTQDGYKLYKCISATTGVFDVNDWSEVCVTDELGSGGGGSSTLAGLNDVAISSAANGQVLTYDSTTSKWKNASAPSDGHTYMGNDGTTAMTQRDKAQFVGAYMEDDGSNNKTKVNVMRSMTRAEFDLLSAAEKKGLIDVTDETEGVNDKFQPVIYSESEREIGVWTNGKPLYERTVVLTNTLTVSGVNWVSTGIATTADAVVYCYPMDANNNYCGGIPCAVVNGEFAFNGSLGNAYIKSFIVQYTKSTDTAGSGQWTPQGVPAVHYSTDEQVVGTFVNGKPLYQKTHNMTVSVDTNGTLKEVTLDVSALNIESVAKIEAVMANTSALPQIMWTGSYPYITRVYHNPSQHWLVLASNRLDDNGKAVRVTIQYTKTTD